MWSWPIHIHTLEYYPVIKNEILPFETTLMDPEGIMLSEKSWRKRQRKVDIVRFHLYVESLKNEQL